MEVVGGLASSLQLISQCGQVTVTIIKWVEAVKTVDDRIKSFVHEVNTLSATYQGLKRGLEEPSMQEAARVTNRDVGGHLWAQLSHTLRDCERTLAGITNVLRRIETSGSKFDRFIKQLRESLYGGELARLREEVVMYNSSLQLPMQMISLTLQLKQAEINTAREVQLNDQLDTLRNAIQRVENLSRGLVSPHRQQSAGETTLVGSTTSDKAWFDNMENYVESAKKFLGTASAAASTLSTSSVAQHEGIVATMDMRRGSSFVPLTHQQLNSISTYVDDLPRSRELDTPTASDTHSLAVPSHGEEASNFDEVDLQLLKNLLTNGHQTFDEGNFLDAEDNFRSALTIAQRQDFGARVACSSADITLMLGECLAKQDKLDEAVNILLPLTQQLLSNEPPKSSAMSTISWSTELPDRGQVLSACHLLGLIYLKRTEYVPAEKYAVQAFKGRNELLGGRHQKTIESVTLVIEMYTAKGQRAMAEAHRPFLKIPVSSPVPQEAPTSPILTNCSSPASRISEKSVSSPKGKSKFSRGIPFIHRRSDRNQNLRASSEIVAPLEASGSNGLLLAQDGVNHLSTSPHDTASLHIGSDKQSIRQQTRHDSTNSTASVSGYVTTRQDTLDAGARPHRRTSSGLSKGPTLYAAMSHNDMERKFAEIAASCAKGNTSKPGMNYLKQYDPGSEIFVHRTDELESNIRKSNGKGLAGTGRGFSPLHFFCSLGYEALTEINCLLQSGADVDAVAYKAGYGSRMQPNTPLSLAVERGHTNVVRLLLDHGATWKPEFIKAGQSFSIDRDTMHPLLQACAKGYTSVLQSLLDSGMSLSEESFPRYSWHGNSLLHEASYRCNVDMIRLLVAFARQDGSLATTTYSFIGRPGQQDAFGVTPIMSAIDMRDSANDKLMTHKRRRRLACLRVLLSSDADIQVQETDSGEIVVDHAEVGSPGRLAHDLNLEDKKGNTVFWYADEVRGGDSELRAFLNEQSQKSRLIDI